MAQTFQKKFKAIVGLLVLIIGSLIAQSSASGTTFNNDKIVIWVFDVGQGDAIFIDAPHKQILIDGGPDGQIIEKLSAVMPFWDHSIDLIINTHPHSDHVTGLVKVLERYDVAEVWDSGQEYGSDVFEYYQELKEGRENSVEAGEKIDLGLGAELEVMWPTFNLTDQRLPNVHNGNVVTLLTYGEGNMLITGDFEDENELQILEDLPHIDVLKVGHHGSLTSTSIELLNAITPNYAVISVGKDNDYGHPHPIILDRLKRAGAYLLRTDKEGDVRIMMNGSEPEIELFRL